MLLKKKGNGKEKEKGGMTKEKLVGNALNVKKEVSNGHDK